MGLLEKHFDIAFAAPNGVEKLRELILTLAVQGKLVRQEPNDLAAEELLKNIKTEAQRLAKEGKIKKPKQLPKVEADEFLYKLPKGWEWLRIRDICHDWGQKTPDGLFTYIDVGSIDNKNGMVSDNVQVIEGSAAPSRARKIVHKGTVVYSTVRPYLLNIAIIDREYAPEPIASTAFAILHPYTGVSNRFVYYYLRSSAFIRYVEDQMKGVAYPAINDGSFFKGVFPLPPLEEQRRIVAKIDQLMARCDELEKLRAERDRLQVTVHKVACDRLLTAKDPDTFTQSWQFITQHFSELYSVKENVTELRKAILQLAVMGKLVPQDPNNPPARELLKEIDTEKKRLLKEKKIKKPVPLSKIESMEVPHPLPKGWEYMRLGDFGYILGGGTPNKSDAKCWDGTIPWIRPKNMKVDYISDSQDRISDFALSKSTVKLIPENSLLMVVRGMILAHSFPAAITTAVVTINQDMKALCPYVSSTANYLLLSTKGRKDYFLSLIERSSHGTCRLETNKLFSTVLAVPPLPEQHRIVAKVDQIMSLCDQLEQQIDQATQKQTALLNAVIHQI